MATFAIPFETRAAREAVPRVLRGSRKGGPEGPEYGEFIEKTVDKVQVASTETKRNESVNFLKELIRSGSSLEI